MKIFVISLKNSQARKQSIREQLEPLNVDWQFFDAVDGRKALPERLENLQADIHRKIFRSRPLSPGEKGCYASHYLLWEKCIELNENIVILEDDLNLTPFFLPCINALNDLHQSHSYIKIEPSESKLIPFKFSGAFQIFKLLNNFSRTIGYSLTPKAAKAFINKNKPWSSPVDGFIGQGYIHKIQSCSITPYAVFPSDLLQKTKKFHSTIQLEEKTKVNVLFKGLREIARFIRFIRLKIWNLSAK